LFLRLSDFCDIKKEADNFYDAVHLKKRKNAGSA